MKKANKRFEKKEQISEFSEKTQRFAEKHIGIINLRAVLTAIAVLILVAGSVIVVGQGTGYTVYYGDKLLGFVSSPGEILENISNINDSISKEVQAEAMVDESEFTFERGVKLFSEKDEWTEIADEANSQCDIDVNVYDIYVDGELIAQDSSIDGAVNAMSQIKQEYKEKNPNDNCDDIDFEETVEINISKAESVESADQEELYKAMSENLTVQTVSFVDEEKTVNYNVVFETSDSIAAGTQKVKQEGKNGITKITTKIERLDGEIISKEVVKKVVVEEPQDKIILVSKNSGLTTNKSGFVNPTKGLLTSKMGMRWGRMHRGIDIANSVGTAIYSSLGGTVKVAEYKNNGYGNVIQIDHGNGIVTLYAHLSSINCKKGDKVDAGTLIGAMGSTGRSTGSHLHFEVLINGTNVDPLLYVSY